MTDAPAARFVEVAVPLPLPQALTYGVPPALAAQAEIGRRARVRVGKRKLTGVIVGLPDAAPEGVTVRAVDAIVDRAPVLTAELLALAEWVSDYYLAPPGEVLKAITPPADTPWGDRRVWLTDAGALAMPRDVDEAQVLDELRSVGRASLAELQASTGLGDLEQVVGRLTRQGKLGISAEKRRGSRFTSAVELAAGDLDELRERCGRSAQGREVVDLLSSLGRPATVNEVVGTVGCGKGVVRRLVSLGVLRTFSQIERLALDQHLVTAGGEAPEIQLRPDQTSAASAIEKAVEGAAFAGLLLRGVTGSGKTEVYLRGVTAALEQGRGAILLVPEIALVPALASTLRQRYGPRLAILHSNLTGSERQQEWERVRQGEAQVVLGPRSAVFAPVTDLGLIVVDEEQDSAYKQDTTPRYNGRDLALLRGQLQGAAVVLVSATPSLEARLNAERGKLNPLTLTERVGQGELPEGILVDLKEEGAVRRPGEVRFSDRLRDEIERSLRHGEQVILLRNRRGYAPVLLCRACGEDMRCDDCGLPRTFHKRDRRLLCHYCGSRLPAPSRCPACSSEALEPVGAGTERVEEEFRRLFPDVSVDTLDRDSVRRPGSVAAVLERFGRGETQVLVGTQMVSKGHHFPGVGLTAVLHADTYLGFPDFRAVERTYNLLTQLAGRSGRGERPGRIVIQTLHPEHYAIRAALAHDDDRFQEEEMRFRRVFHYPPYTRMIQLLARDRSRERAEGAIRELNRRIGRHPLASEVRVSGPAPAPFEKLRGRWRFQLLVRSASAVRLRRLVRDALGEKPPAGLVVDVDPYELL
jgi:primosomal protein N' (replication factor Y)